MSARDAPTIEAAHQAPPPPSEWGRDPLFWAFARVLCADVARLETAPGLTDGHVLDGRRPLSKVELVARVVSRRTTARCVEFAVDDGTGPPAKCILWNDGKRSPPPEFVPLRLGDLVRVRGTLKLQRWAKAAVEEEEGSSGDGSRSSESGSGGKGGGGVVERRQIFCVTVQTLDDPNEEVSGFFILFSHGMTEYSTNILL